MLPRRWLGLHVGGTERYPGNRPAIEAHFEGVATGVRQRNVEHQHCAGFDIGNSRGGLPELDGTITGQQLCSSVVHKPNAHGVSADFGSPAAHSENQVSARVDCGKLRYPDVLKQPQNRELSLLIDQGVISQYGEIEMQR